MTVLYNHPALPPKGIKVGIPYPVIFDGESFIVDNIKFDKDTFYLLFKITCGRGSSLKCFYTWP